MAWSLKRKNYVLLYNAFRQMSLFVPYVNSMPLLVLGDLEMHKWTGNGNQIELRFPFHYQISKYLEKSISF